MRFERLFVFEQLIESAIQTVFIDMQASSCSRSESAATNTAAIFSQANCSLPGVST